MTVDLSQCLQTESTMKEWRTFELLHVPHIAKWTRWNSCTMAMLNVLCLFQFIDLTHISYCCLYSYTIFMVSTTVHVRLCFEISAINLL